MITAPSDLAIGLPDVPMLAMVLGLRNFVNVDLIPVELDFIVVFSTEPARTLHPK